MAPKFCGRQAEEICAARLRTKAQAGQSRPSQPVFSAGGANFGRESSYSNGLRRHFPATRPRREESAARTAGAPAAGLSAGRHLPARIAGFQRLAAPFRGAMRGRAGAHAGRTAVGPLSATQALSRFLQVPQGTPATPVAEGLHDKQQPRPVSVNDAGPAPRSELSIQERRNLAQIPVLGKEKLTIA